MLLKNKIFVFNTTKYRLNVPYLQPRGMLRGERVFFEYEKINIYPKKRNVVIFGSGGGIWTPAKLIKWNWFFLFRIFIVIKRLPIISHTVGISPICINFFDRWCFDHWPRFSFLCQPTLNLRLNILFSILYFAFVHFAYAVPIPKWFIFIVGGGCVSCLSRFFLYFHGHSEVG